MPAIDYPQREVRLRFGIAGAPGVGKRATLRRLHANLALSERTDISETLFGADRLWHFEFVPGELLPIADYRAQATVVLFTGALTQTATCARAFADLDALLFVADSAPAQLNENLAALKRLGTLRALRDVPVILFYNKRDVPGALSIPALDAVLNPLHAVRREGVASNGEGVDGLLADLTRATLAASA